MTNEEKTRPDGCHLGVPIGQAWRERVVLVVWRLVVVSLACDLRVLEYTNPSISRWMWYKSGSSLKGERLWGVGLFLSGERAMGIDSLVQLVQRGEHCRSGVYSLYVATSPRMHDW